MSLELATSFLNEMGRRGNYALNHFRPMPTQDKFLTSPWATEWLLKGGNRCSAEGTVVWKIPKLVTPSTEVVEARIEDIVAGDFVVGFNPADETEFVPALVERVETFSEAGMRVHVGSGKSTVCTHDHPFFCKGGWVNAEDLTADDKILTLDSMLDDSEPQWDAVTFVESTDVVKFIAIKTSTENYIGDGFFCHNSGKSTVAAVRFAAIALDFPLHDSTGAPIHTDRMVRKRYGGHKTMWCIGLGEKHIGQTFHRLLFEPGAFDLVKMPNGKMRAFNPATDKRKLDRDGLPKRGRDKSTGTSYDLTEEGLFIVPAPPLIPPEDIAKLAYDNVSKKVWERCLLKNGNEIYAFTSNANVPKMGDPVDVVWVDEQVMHPQHYYEWAMRTVDTNGEIWWSTFPGMRSGSLIALNERAEDFERREDPRPKTARINLTMSGNEFLDQTVVQSKLSILPDQERMARDLGEFAEDYFLMYPMFDPIVHGVPDEPVDGDQLSQVFHGKDKFKPPRNWCRYLVLDPGHTYTACLLFAVPPPEDYYDNCVVVYDEIYLTNKSASEFAKVAKARIGDDFFETFIIDGHAARMTSIGRAVGDTNGKLYVDAFKELGLKSRTTGHNFKYGSDNVAAGCGAVREWLLRRDREGTPKLRFVLENLPNTTFEINNYVKEVMKDVIDDKPAARQRDHAMDCLRYAASDGLPYRAPPESVQSRGGSSYGEFLKWQERMGADDNGPPVFQCGPGRAA